MLRISVSKNNNALEIVLPPRKNKGVFQEPLVFLMVFERIVFLNWNTCPFMRKCMNYSWVQIVSLMNGHVIPWLYLFTHEYNMYCRDWNIYSQPELLLILFTHEYMIYSWVIRSLTLSFKRRKSQLLTIVANICWYLLKLINIQ